MYDLNDELDNLDNFIDVPSFSNSKNRSTSLVLNDDNFFYNNNLANKKPRVRDCNKSCCNDDTFINTGCSNNTDNLYDTNISRNIDNTSCHNNNTNNGRSIDNIIDDEKIGQSSIASNRKRRIITHTCTLTNTLIDPETKEHVHTRNYTRRRTRTYSPKNVSTEVRIAVRKHTRMSENTQNLSYDWCNFWTHPRYNFTHNKSVSKTGEKLSKEISVKQRAHQPGRETIHASSSIPSTSKLPTSTTPITTSSPRSVTKNIFQSIENGQDEYAIDNILSAELMPRRSLKRTRKGKASDIKIPAEITTAKSTLTITEKTKATATPRGRSITSPGRSSTACSYYDYNNIDKRKTRTHECTNANYNNEDDIDGEVSYNSVGNPHGRKTRKRNTKDTDINLRSLKMKAQEYLNVIPKTSRYRSNDSINWSSANSDDIPYGGNSDDEGSTLSVTDDSGYPYENTEDDNVDDGGNDNDTEYNSSEYITDNVRRNETYYQENGNDRTDRKRKIVRPKPVNASSQNSSNARKQKEIPMLLRPQFAFRGNNDNDKLTFVNNSVDNMHDLKTTMKYDDDEVKNSMPTTRDSGEFLIIARRSIRHSVQKRLFKPIKPVPYPRQRHHIIDSTTSDYVTFRNGLHRPI